LTAVDHANINFKSIKSYCKNNNLFLNTKKTKCMLINFNDTDNKLLSDNSITFMNEHNLFIRLDNTDIEVVDNFKFLGYYIDNKLTWKPHINYVNTKLKAINCKIITFKSFLPVDILTLIFRSVGLSYLYYCADFISNACQKDLQTLRVQYNEICRSICNVKIWDKINTVILLESLELSSFDYLIQCIKMKIILQAAHGLSPPYFSNMFINKNERTMKITQIHCNNLKSQKIMFNFYAIKMWNELPLDYKKLTYLEKIKLM